MKKLWLVFIAITLIALLLVPSVAAAEEQNENPTQNSEIYTFVEQLCELNKANDKNVVRDFLVSKFNEALSGANDVEVGEQIFSIEGLNESFVNLEAKLTKSGATKQIIIGAHYDTAYGIEGAGDNACGIAALYLTMKTLARNSTLPYNVVFVAFDAEERGLWGSQHYVETMSAQVITNTLVMFNIDTIATGDNLYVMCENKSTDLAKLILSNAEGVREKPYAKGIFGNIYDAFGYGYYEMIQGTDHTPFRLAGIPTASLFSGAFTITGYVENSDPNKALMNTSSDTFANLIKLHPNFESRITAVSDAIVKTVTSGNFTNVAENARKQLVNLNFWYNRWWAILAVAVIAIVAIVLAIVYYRKLQKNALIGETEIKSQTVFDKPKAEDIFTFKK